MKNFIASVPLALGLIAACDSGTSPKNGHPVDFRLAASAPLTAAGPLSIVSFQLVAGGAALGSGDQFGCQDCQNSGPETTYAPEIVTVPLHGTPVQLRTEQVQPGTYSMMEVEVVVPTAQIVAATPGLTAASSMLITGTYGGRPFQLALPIEGTFREQLATPMVIGSSGAPASVTVTLTLPVLAWFTGAGGTLDPTDATQRGLIEANARKSFGPLEKSGAESSR